MFNGNFFQTVVFQCMMTQATFIFFGYKTRFLTSIEKSAQILMGQRALAISALCILNSLWNGHKVQADNFQNGTEIRIGIDVSK